MSANVESAFSANGIPMWHGIGDIIEEAPTSHDAIVAAGLDWKVNTVPVMIDAGKGSEIVPNYWANVRETDNSVLGVVSDRYKIVQNADAFAFTDNLIKNDFGVEVKYETAGSLNNGKRVWMLAKLPMQTILGDEFVPYIVFVNNHDGKGSVRVAMTPTRVVCQNTLTLALDMAKRSWSTTHAGDLQGKLEEAQDTLQMAQAYMEGLEARGEELQQMKISDELYNDLLDELYPINPFAKGTKKNANNAAMRKTVTDLYNTRYDLKKFRGTAWGIYQAFADSESHLQPKRQVTDTFLQRRFAGFIDGRNALRDVEAFFAKVA